MRCRWYRYTTGGPLTDRRSPPVALAVALSPADSPRAPGNHHASPSHAGHQLCQASRATTWWHLGCISAPSKNTDKRQVAQ